jgi:hypothetical protein
MIRELCVPAEKRVGFAEVRERERESSALALADGAGFAKETASKDACRPEEMDC